DVEGVPVAVEPPGEARGIAEEGGGLRALRRQADHDLIWSLDAGPAAGSQGLLAAPPAPLEPGRPLAESQLAQALQVLGLEEAGESARGALGIVDPPLLEASDEVFGREIDVHDLIGLGEHPVGEALAYLDAHEPLDRVVEAFEVLDVERGDDVDAGREQLLDVEIALLVPAAGDVRVRQLVDQDDLGAAREEAFEIHLLEMDAAVDDLAQ